jgi:hypothetical protein
MNYKRSPCTRKIVIFSNGKADSILYLSKFRTGAKSLGSPSKYLCGAFSCAFYFPQENLK